ncbi:alanine--tRNA ligase-related protein [Spiroplasma endosymbiont of Labia minor]|uniref:alanine--tRNA ligase-related protein n=1 Tax=Spiroplasma endosymbiont of Labia minor TaxID=3066305 RepID=UPI0030CA8586
MEINWNVLNDINGINKTEYLGYHQNNLVQPVKYLFNLKGEKVDHSTSLTFIVFDKTVFYATGGAQPFDTGYLIKDNKNYEVLDVEKKFIKNVYVHLVDFKNEEIKIGDVVTQKYDEKRRHNHSIHHTASHMLYTMSVKKILNLEEISQGLDEEKTWSQFTGDNVTWDKIQEIVDEVNKDVEKNIIQNEMFMSKEEAFNNGYIAYDKFIDRYDNIVRAVEFKDSTTDLCGGTHVQSTGEIKHLYLVDVESAKKGFLVTVSAFQNTINKHFIIKIKNILNQIKDIKAKILKLNNSYSLDIPYDVELSQANRNYFEYLNNLLIKIQGDFKIENKLAQIKQQEQLEKLTFNSDVKKINEINVSINNFSNQLIDNKILMPKTLKSIQVKKASIELYFNNIDNTNILLLVSADLKNKLNLNKFLDILKKYNVNYVGGGSNLICQLSINKIDKNNFENIFFEWLKNIY